jgi:acyl CoA:acetate/3-ketoacid CoA transferase beta subunit
MVPTLPYVTSPGRAVTAVATDLGVLEKVDGELVLTALAPGVSVDDARAACGWPLRAATDALPVLDPPTTDELVALRSWDRHGWFLRA